jgi:hypothetical protein
LVYAIVERFATVDEHDRDLVVILASEFDVGISEAAVAGRVNHRSAARIAAAGFEKRCREQSGRPDRPKDGCEASEKL